MNSTPNNEPAESRPTGGWFKASRSEDAMELLRTAPNAFMLAYVIAYRARYKDGFNRHGIGPGEAMLGDWKECGISEQNYRTAKAQLAKWGFATFKPTNAGTVASLMDTRLFDVVPSVANDPTNGRVTDGSRTGNGRVTDGSRLQEEQEEREELKKGNKGEPPQLSASLKELLKLDLWQLEKDENRLVRQIDQEEETARGTDRGLLIAMRDRLSEIRKARKMKLVANRPATPPVPSKPTVPPLDMDEEVVFAGQNRTVRRWIEGSGMPMHLLVEAKAKEQRKQASN